MDRGLENNRIRLKPPNMQECTLENDPAAHSVTPLTFTQLFHRSHKA